MITAWPKSWVPQSDEKDNEYNRRNSETWMKSIDEERDSSFKLNQGQKTIWKGKGRSKL